MPAKGSYVYFVTDGTKKRPMGLVGITNSKPEARELRARKCRMGGYILRVYVPNNKDSKKC